MASQSDKTNLLGADKKAAAQVNQWINFADDEIFERAGMLRLMCRGLLPYNKAVEGKMWEELERACAVLEQHLLLQTFVVGHRLTLADLTLASDLYLVYTEIAGEQWRAKYPNTLRYYRTVVNQRALGGAIPPNAQLLKENAKYVPPKEDKPKEAPKKQEKKDSPKAEGAAGGAAPPASEKPAKPKNPLDELPKSNFSLEEWKRVYMNEDTRPKALPWFYEHYDPEGFSIWRFDFKYNEELTQIFMSSNQISGFFTRLEASRKYVMGTAGVFGKANDSAIAGVVVLRGKDWQPVLSVAPDIESYSVTPLDLGKPEDKKFFEDVLAWEATVDGKEWADGKILK